MQTGCCLRSGGEERTYALVLAFCYMTGLCESNNPMGKQGQKYEVLDLMKVV